MSETPRTDEFLESAFREVRETETLEDFARQLERELAARRAENAELRKHAEALYEIADADSVDEDEYRRVLDAYRADFPEEK